MPELPEVEVSARVAAAALTGRVVQSVELTDCKLFRPPSSRGRPVSEAALWEPQALSALLLGARGSPVGSLRVGKLMASCLTSAEGRALTLFARLGMTGKYVSAHAEAPLRAGVKLSLSLSDREGEPAVIRLDHINMRMFGQLWARCSEPLLGEGAREAAHRAHFEEERLASRLGPDALELAEQPQRWVERLRSCADHRRVKVSLLDQELIAGVGNIYAAEGIFEARAHPLARVSSLSDEQLALIARGAREAMWGTLSRSAGRGEVIYGAGQGQRVSPFKVYGREGLPCLRCEAPLVKLTISGRGTVICERCQPEP